MTKKILHLKTTDPYFNLATEEYLLRNFKDDFFLLWQSENAVIVGKNQNAIAEINHPFVRKNKICVARRLSGGGTVFHDMGNINFSFIWNQSEANNFHSDDYNQIIINILEKLGIKLTTSSHHDILIGKEKITGSAEGISRGRILHHGTLLFNSCIKNLKNAIDTDLSKFTDKAIASRRSDVTNISDHIKNKISIDEFTGFLIENIRKEFPGTENYELTMEDQKAIDKLRKEKYTQWDWIYGKSPRYKFRNELKTKKGKLTFSLIVKKGIIIDSQWKGDISKTLISELTSKLINTRHNIYEIEKSLKSVEEQISRENISFQEFLMKFE